MSTFENRELELEFLQTKLNRKDQDIVNIRKRLDQVLDELDKEKAKNNLLEKKIDDLECDQPHPLFAKRYNRPMKIRPLPIPIRNDAVGYVPKMIRNFVADSDGDEDEEDN